MKNSKIIMLALILMVVIVLFITMIKSWQVFQYPIGNPPDTTRAQDLVGVWEADYGWGIDRIEIKEDGTFQQVFTRTNPPNYSFNTSWEPLWLEHFSDGRIRLHLSNARYFLASIDLAEKQGINSQPCLVDTDLCENGEMKFSIGFFDPVSRDIIHMQGELVLNLRADELGNYFLMHMWRSSEGGYAIFGGEREIFKLIKN